jgi:excisionase family DNA binding protein
MNNFNQTQYLTPKEIAEKLKINLLTVYSYIRKKKLTAIRIGTNYRIDQVDFEKFIELNKTNVINK